MLVNYRWNTIYSQTKLLRFLSKRSSDEQDGNKHHPSDEETKSKDHTRKTIKATDLFKHVTGFQQRTSRPMKDTDIHLSQPTKLSTPSEYSASQTEIKSPSHAVEERNKTTKSSVIESKVLLKHIAERMSHLPLERRRASFFNRFSQKLPSPEDLNWITPQTTERSVGQVHQEPSKSTNPIFDTVENIESSLLMLTAPLNQFEEWLKWTVEGKLWKFPIDNEQDWETESDVPFHEHMFFDRFTDKTLLKSPPVAAFLDFVCSGLAQNPNFTVAQKREHLRWYADYFKDKLDFIDASVQEELRLAELERKARASNTPSQ